MIDLAQVGIVEVFPQRGSRISFVNWEMVEESQFMRSALERAVCQRLCTAEKPPDLMLLTENLCAQAAAVARRDSEAFFRLDNEFHRLFFQLAGMVHIYQLFTNFMIHFDRLRNLSLSVQDNDQLIADHREMVDCLRRRDEPGMSRVVDRHLQRYKIDEKAVRQSYPAFFQEEERSC